MWAALTELHPMLRMYEAFAFRGLKGPRRLESEQRDQFIREVGAYLRLHGAPEEEIPESMDQLSALYAKYAEHDDFGEIVAHGATKRTDQADGRQIVATNPVVAAQRPVDPVVAIPSRK